MKNLLVAVLLSVMPLSTFAWDVPWGVKDDYNEEKRKREDAEKNLETRKVWFLF